MDDLAAFLAARYDEAEARERRMLEMLAKDGPEATLAVCFDDGTSGDAYDWNPWDVIEDYDPVHRLRDIALKRAILAEHAPVPGLLGRPICRICWTVRTEGGPLDGDPHPCATVRRLGTEFSEHPDYKQEWAPEA